MVHPSLSLITYDGKSQGKTIVYITRMACDSKKDDFLRRYSVTGSECPFFFFFLMLAWVDGQRRSVLFIFFLTPGPQTAQSADKHRLNSRNQSRLGTRYRAHWQLSPRWGSSVTTCAIVAPNRPPVICRAAFLFRAAEILGRTLSFPCR